MMALPLTYGQEVEEEIGGNSGRKCPGDKPGAIQVQTAQYLVLCLQEQRVEASVATLPQRF